MIAFPLPLSLFASLSNRNGRCPWGESGGNDRAKLPAEKIFLKQQGATTTLSIRRNFLKCGNYSKRMQIHFVADKSGHPFFHQ